ncbi:MAG: inorganic phosphate transporter [Coleofasciculaceae cyanobacterium SM2_1_6]|nr:inorganic phosphate transporter [Coleofasciculaceae cyanobacterium SM2_1_6]
MGELQSIDWLRWGQIGFVGLLGFWLAMNLGANDVANSVGTSVGTKALSVGQALVLAGILEFLGAVFFGDRVIQTLVTQLVNPETFATQPQILLLGMMAVLITGAIWLQLATHWGFPVSSSQAVVGAIAGFTLAAAGVRAVNWQSIGIISALWLITPLMSGIVAWLFQSIIRRGILEDTQGWSRLQEWLPWLSWAIAAIFGGIVLPAFLSHLPLGWGGVTAEGFIVILIGLGAIGIFLFSNGARLGIESQFSRLQILSAGFVAFAHGANDVGNAIAPVVIITHIFQTGVVPTENLDIPLPVILLGGGGIVTGLALWGQVVMKTIGTNLTPLLPSGGLGAELATATTVLFASRLGLPVSTSHALVGAVLGTGLGEDRSKINWEITKNIMLTWMATIPLTTGLSALIFLILRLFYRLE